MPPHERKLVNEQVAPFLLINKEFDMRKYGEEEAGIGYKSIRKGVSTIFGRSQNHITTKRFPDMANNLKVSRSQFRVLYDGENVTITDGGGTDGAGSKNGTMIEFIEGTVD